MTSFFQIPRVQPPRPAQALENLDGLADATLERGARRLAQVADQGAVVQVIGDGQRFAFGVDYSPSMQALSMGALCMRALSVRAARPPPDAFELGDEVLHVDHAAAQGIDSRPGQD